MNSVARVACIALTASLLAAAGALLAACGGADDRRTSATPNLPPTTVTVADPLECLREGRVSLAAENANVFYGSSTTLTWSVSFPPDCTAAKRGRLNLAGQSVAPAGKLGVSPKVTSRYLLAITVPGKGQIKLAEVLLTVKVPEGATVDIEGDTEGWKNLLIDALAAKGATVRLAEHVNMDLTGHEGVHITEGVKLIGGRTAQKAGPRLYTSSRPKPLFVIRCNAEHTIWGDNVRIEGFRLQGPHPGIGKDDPNLERGIDIDSCTGIEIANMELTGWSGEAVHVGDSVGRMLNPGQVKIHHSFIHHNQHEGTSGYGVNVTDGAYALIERNVFDFNRHAIALGHHNAGLSGYRAQQNLVLAGGGVHVCVVACTHTHQFDVHGDKNCSIRNDAWNCGAAGQQLWFTENAFQYHEGNAIKLRGTPSIEASIDNNVFVQKKLTDKGPNLGGEAVELYGDHLRVRLGPNTVGVNTFGQYGVCDFDGDNKDDLFLPTGATWWYSSAGRMHWVFLKAARERIDQLALGYFDGDQRCDVFAVNGGQWEISSGGTGPWRSLGTYGVPLDQLRFGHFGSIRDHRPERGNRPTHAFRRAPDGQWSVVTPGKQDWRPLQSSGQPLGELRLGDFGGDGSGGISAGDGITDVLTATGGRWKISRSGAGSWEVLNPYLSSSVKSVLIADVNGNGTDDVVRFTLDAPSRGRWEVSWEGASNWAALHTLPVTTVPGTGQPVFPTLFAGRFDDSPGADLLATDALGRVGLLYSKATGKVVQHSLHPY